MPEPVFHFFEQLPQELQMHIWKYAATPETKLELNDYILRHIGRNRSSRTVETSSYHARFLKHTSATLLHRGIIFKMPESGSHAKITATARTSLLGTCRLARQVVLETWKTDIQRISISGSNFDGQFARYQQKEAARKVVVKVELVVALQDLIALVQEGKASCIPRRLGASRRLRATRPDMYKEEDENEGEEEIAGGEDDEKM